MNQRQRGNTVIGLIIGIVLGLGVALGIAVYVTKVPIPFMTKTQRGGAEQDQAEAQKNRNWDPNGPLAGKGARGPVQNGPVTPVAPESATGATPSNPVPVVVAPSASPSAAASAARAAAAARVTPTEANRPAASSDPLGDLARARSGDSSAGTTTASAAPTTDAFMYFVQAGAFRTTEDAEAQRAKLSLMGVEAKVTEREQAGRTVYRVRAGPFNKKDDADRLKDRLDGGGLESALVRVQR